MKQFHIINEANEVEFTGPILLRRSPVDPEPGNGLAKPFVETAYSTDWAGRQVHADFASLQRAARIVIDSDAADKHFHIDIAHPQRLEAA